MASIRKAKKLAKKQGVVFKSPTAERKKLVRETREMVNQVNKRLRNLERGNNYNSYASKKLFDRLDTKSLNVLQKSKKGRRVLSVKVKKSLTNTQLKAVQKASKQFLTSKTSTSRGISEVATNTKDAMLKTLKLDPNTNVTKQDVEDYYDMLSSKDFDYFNDKIGASSMWGLMEDAKEQNMSENQFISLIEKYMMSLDEDAREKAKRLYEKYIV